MTDPGKKGVVIKKSQIVNRTGGVETDDGRVLFGIDAEHYQKMKAKEDPEWERKIGEWIEFVVGDKLDKVDDLYWSLRSGLVLCKLMNKVKEGTIPKYSLPKKGQTKLHPLMERENITLYLEACWKVGITSNDMFVVADLHTRQGMSSVLNNLAALSQLAVRLGCKVPALGPSKPKNWLDPEAEGKKQPKWEVNMPTTVSTADAVDDDEDVEALEDELHQIKMKLEESQRTISQLEKSKTNLASLLDEEKKKLADSEGLVNTLRSSSDKGPAELSFVEQLKKHRDELLAEVEQLKAVPQVDTERERLRAELSELKSRTAGSDSLQSENAKFGERVKALETELADERRLKDEAESRLATMAANPPAGDAEELNRLKTRITELEAARETLGAGSSEETKKLMARVKVLEDEKHRVETDYNAKLQKLREELETLRFSSDNELKKLRESVGEAEKARGEAVSALNDLRNQMDNELRASTHQYSMDLTKLQNEVKRLEMEKGLAEKESTNLKESLARQLEQVNNACALRVQEIENQITTLKKAKEELTKELSTQKSELEAEVTRMRSRATEQQEALKAQIDGLQAEKKALTEKLFADTQKLNQEHFQKENALQKQLEEQRIVNEDMTRELSGFKETAGSLEVIKVDHSSEVKKLQSEISRLQREKTYLEQQASQEKEKLTQQNLAAQDAVERQLLAEKKEREKLEADFKVQREKLSAEIAKIRKRAEDDIAALHKELAELEKSKQKALEDASAPLRALQEEAKQIKSNAQKETTQLTAKISELETERANIAEDREEVRKQLHSEVEALKQRVQKEQDKHRDEMIALEAERKALQQRSKELELEKQSALSTTTAAQNRFLDELTAIRKTFEVALASAPRAAAAPASQPSSNTEMAKKYDDLQMELLMSEEKYKSEIERMKKDMTDLETNLKNQYTVQIKQRDDLILTQQKGILQLKAAAKGGAQPQAQAAPAPASGLATSSPAGPRPAEKPTKSAMDRNRRRTKRFTIYASNAKSVNTDLASLKDMMDKIMVGEQVSYDKLTGFRQLFKLDSGRRVLAFMLKEYAAMAAEGQPFLLPASSFDMLKVMVELVLSQLDLSNGADYISAKILLEVSSLIAREIKGSSEVEYIQTLIKPHDCWKNTFFWSEYFWAQATPRFEELFGEGAPEQQITEKQFFQKEIVEFVKGMWGWGGLASQQLLLFAESLASKCDLLPPEMQPVLKQLEEFCVKKQSKQQKGERTQRKRLFTASTIFAKSPVSFDEMDEEAAEEGGVFGDNTIGGTGQASKMEGDKPSGVGVTRVANWTQAAKRGSGPSPTAAAAANANVAAINAAGPAPAVTATTAPTAGAVAAPASGSPRNLPLPSTPGNRGSAPRPQPTAPSGAAAPAAAATGAAQPSAGAARPRPQPISRSATVGTPPAETPPQRPGHSPPSSSSSPTIVAVPAAAAPAVVQAQPAVARTATAGARIPPSRPPPSVPSAAGGIKKESMPPPREPSRRRIQAKSMAISKDADTFITGLLSAVSEENL